MIIPPHLSFLFHQQPALLRPECTGRARRHILPSLATNVLRSIIVVAALAALAVAIPAEEVALHPQDGEIVVTIDGQPFARYYLGRDRKRPYFYDVRASDGTLVTRPISPPGGDHAHHTGIWHAVDAVNSIRFWHEEGRIHHQSAKLTQPTGDPAVMQLRHRWISPTGTAVLNERTTVSIHRHRLFCFDIRLTAMDERVTFEDTEEGFFAIRLAPYLCEEQTGRVVNAAGVRGAKHCWGKTSDWIDYYGQIEGQTYGVAIFDHPSNFRRSRYHVRDYGLFAISPFGEESYSRGELNRQPVTLAAGATLQLRYGIYIHDGDTNQGAVAAVYRAFASETHHTGAKRSPHPRFLSRWHNVPVIQPRRPPVLPTPSTRG